MTKTKPLSVVMVMAAVVAAIMVMMMVGVTMTVPVAMAVVVMVAMPVTMSLAVTMIVVPNLQGYVRLVDQSGWHGWCRGRATKQTHHADDQAST